MPAFPILRDGVWPSPHLTQLGSSQQTRKMDFLKLHNTGVSVSVYLEPTVLIYFWPIRQFAQHASNTFKQTFTTLFIFSFVSRTHLAWDGFTKLSQNRFCLLLSTQAWKIPPKSCPEITQVLSRTSLGELNFPTVFCKVTIKDNQNHQEDSFEAQSNDYHHD